MSRPPYLSDDAINRFIDSALAEDIGSGDVTTRATLQSDSRIRAQLLVKDSGLIAGLELAQKIFHRFDPSLQIEFKRKEGDVIVPGDVCFIVEGSARSILSCERVVLNCLQRMSGVATLTSRLCSLIADTGAALMDTRKTTPNFRLPEKWAVAIGGGTNHRFALYDMIMIKDNHIDIAGGIEPAIRHVRSYLDSRQSRLKVEIETRNLDEVRAVVKCGGVDVVMLDNMNIATMKTAVELIGGRFKTEASGGISEQNLKAIANCGVDFISMGALTHSVRSLDLSLKVL